MSNTVQTYIDLIPSANQEQPNFIATINLVAAMFVQIQNVANSFVPIFDLDTPPVGQQLDIIGKWVGVSRIIPIPIAGAYFTWNGTAALGWGMGVWEDPNNPSTDITVLPDDVYLTLIRAKIAANNWDGTTEGAYAIWAILFPSFNILIQDNENMSFAVGVQGMVPDSLTLALLTGGYLPLKPEGVLISEYFIPVDTNPFFAWNSDTPYLQGWGTGSWASEVAPT